MSSTQSTTPPPKNPNSSPTVIVSTVIGVVIFATIVIITYGGFNKNPNKINEPDKVSFQKSSLQNSSSQKSSQSSQRKSTIQTFDQSQVVNVEFKEFKLLGFDGDKTVYNYQKPTQKCVDSGFDNLADGLESCSDDIVSVDGITTYNSKDKKASLKVVSFDQIQNNKSNPNYNKNLENKIQIDQFITNKDSVQNSNITDLYRTSAGGYSSVFIKNIEYTMSGLESQRAFLTADGQSSESMNLVLNVIGTKSGNYVWMTVNVYTDQSPQPDGLSIKVMNAIETNANKSLQTKAEVVYFGTDQFKKDIDLATTRLISNFVLEK